MMFSDDEVAELKHLVAPILAEKKRKAEELRQRQAAFDNYAVTARAEMEKDIAGINDRRSIVGGAPLNEWQMKEYREQQEAELAEDLKTKKMQIGSPPIEFSDTYRAILSGFTR